MDKKDTKVERFKKHLVDNKTAYICGGVGALVGAAVGVSVGVALSRPTEASVDLKGIFYNSPVNVTQIVERRGHPGYVVVCNETGEQFASIRRAADLLGLTRRDISKHLNGLVPDVKGFTFTFIGEAQ